MTEKNEKSIRMPQNFQDMIPRSIFAEADPSILDRKATTFTGMTGSTFNASFFANGGGGNNMNIYRNPARRFYDPEITTTAIYLPRNVRQKNRWCRWFFDHDELVGAVLELHAELPYSRAETMVDDPKIKRHTEECFDRTNFFTMLPLIDLEFMKIGEVFIHNTWDNSLGMWNHIIIHNPDFIELTTSPFADTDCVIELKPDDQLRSLVHSTKPEEQQLKKRLPKDVVRRVLTGKNIILDSAEITHIARRSNPYDIRGTSILNRLFRTLMYEDKLRESQITIADNFIYPLKIFKLGDPQKGWIPDESHQKALASMLQQANFDPNFSLIYHYGLSVEYVTVAEKVMKLEKEWQEINDKKMIALGVSKEFMSGTTTYAAANVGLQIQLARYKAKRDLFEVRWIQDKFLRIMAEKNEWYKRDAKEIVGQYRVKRTGEELRQRLIVPKLMWHKKLMMRDDQQFLTFLNNVYAQGKGPISAITLLMSMGLELENELHNKNKQAELQQMIGSYIQAPAATPPGGAPPGLGAMAKLKDKLKLGKKEAAAEVNNNNPIESLIEENINLTDLVPEQHTEFIKHGNYNKNMISREEVMDREATAVSDLTNDIIPVNNGLWLKNIKSERVPFEVNILFTEYDNKLSALARKYNGNFKKGIVENKQDLMKSLINTYVQGKLAAYEWTNFLPIYKQYYSEGEELRDYSDIVLSNEFEDWITKLATMSMDKDKLYRHLRDLATSCFCFGQLKGFQEQGIYSVKVGNSQPMDGIRYKISELLDKGGNLATLISPLGEIVLFSPCIEGFDDIEFGNNIDPHITRYRDFVTADINIKNCPIEYEPFIKRYLNKFGKYLKKQYDNVVFVQDVVNLDEWGEVQTQKLSNDLKDIKSDMRHQAVTATLAQEKIKKLGKIPVFKQGRVLFVSNWIGMEDVPLTEKLIKYISIDNESLYKTINKTFKNANFDLTDEEINTYRIFGYVEQFSNSAGELIGWKVNDNKIKTADVDTKLIIGKMWDVSGKCANNRQKEPIQVFEENLRFYLDYPQKLNKELFEAFESL